MARWAIPVGLLLVFMSRAEADNPLSAPADYTVRSLNRGCYAFLDASRKTTTVFRQKQGGPPIRLWEMPGWFRVVSLSDDCEHLVIGFEGSNLLPLDFKRDLVMLSFYDRGRLLREVKLNELIIDFGNLGRTASHYAWGRYVGFEGQARYIVETAENRRIVFDAVTGKEAPGAK